MKSKVEIIKETRRFYEEDVSRRASPRDGGCYYFLKTDDGITRHCAVGRYLINPELMPNGEIETIMNSGGITDTLDSLLVEDVHGHDVRFWQKLQKLHDNRWFWDEEGMTSKGHEYYVSLLTEYEQS